MSSVYFIPPGLPVQVRDQLLEEAGGAQGITAMTVPQSDTNKQWFAGQHDRMVRGLRGLRGRVDACVKTPGIRRSLSLSCRTHTPQPPPQNKPNAKPRWRRVTPSRTARRR